jgi:uncharacterized protein (DUF1778 family)
MKDNAESHIHLRARQTDRALIDRAAALAGTSRSDFMMSSALKEARNILLDRKEIHLNHADFNALLQWIDGNPQSDAVEGMQRLLSVQSDWQRG